jgi:hypothetical protein
MKTVIFQLSGGITSWAAARKYRDRYPDAPFQMLFADTFIESECAYRFLICGAADIAGVDRPDFWNMEIPSIDLENPEPRRMVLKALADAAMDAIPGLNWIWDGRTPWEVFRDVRFIGNSRVDPCSKKLKRDLMDAWRTERFAPDECLISVGLNWDEDERIERIKERGAPWEFITPLEHRWEGISGDQWSGMGKPQWIEAAAERGLPRSLAYEQNLAHDNCGGGCVKAGIGHWKDIFHKRPEVFAQWEAAEAGLMAELDSPWGMLADRRGGPKKPLPLSALRRRIELGDVTEIEARTLGGCACALPV